MANFGVVGGTLWGNRGAEAMVVTTIGELRQQDPAAKFLLMTYLPARDAELVNDPAVAIVDTTPRVALLIHLPFAFLCWVLRKVGIRVPSAILPAPVRALRTCRALFDVTGISFHDGRLAVVAYNVVCLWPALLLGVPVVRLSQAMGPFERPLNRMPARRIMRASTMSYARGRRTADYLRELGIPDDRWAVAADVAFAYRDEYSITQENDDRVDQVVTRIEEASADGARTVAIVPSSLVFQKMRSDGDDYVGVLCGLVEHLVGRDRRVVVVPNATRAGSESLRNNDIVVVDEVYGRLSTRSPELLGRVDTVSFDLNTAGIRRILSGCELVVTSRFHAMVAALALGVPTLVMGWSHKYEEVLEMFGRAQDALDFSGLDGRLFAMTDELLDDGDAVREQIAAAWPKVLASSRSQFAPP